MSGEIPLAAIHVRWPGADPEADRVFRDEWECDPPVVVSSACVDGINLGVFLNETTVENYVQVNDHEAPIEALSALTPHQLRVMAALFATAAEISERYVKDCGDG